MQTPNNKMITALQNFSTILVLDVLDRKRRFILNICRVKRYLLSLSFVLIMKL